jgi:hypothetical protein
LFPGPEDLGSCADCVASRVGPTRVWLLELQALVKPAPWTAVIAEYSNGSEKEWALE